MRARYAEATISTQSPFHEFWNRAGSLPETIGTPDLDTLNSALRLFFAQLREARQQFEQGEENGRVGAFTALAATWMFILAFKATSKEPLSHSRRWTKALCCPSLNPSRVAVALDPARLMPA
jgi:hypothetical protein